MTQTTFDGHPPRSPSVAALAEQVSIKRGRIKPGAPPHRAAWDGGHRGCATRVGSLVIALVIAGSGCDRTTSRPSSQPAEQSARPVLVYCSADAEFAEPILKDYAKRLNIAITPLFDTEAGKTTGLVNRLLAEKARPRADIWWSSEIFGTIALAQAGVLAEYRPPTAADIPDNFRDSEGRWTAFALRGRVVALDSKRTPPGDLPQTWADLVDPRFAGRIALADPRFGTTRGHMALMLHALGEPEFTRWLTGLRANKVRIVDGNAESVRMLLRNAVEIAVTDTDDALSAQRKNDAVRWVVPTCPSPANDRSTEPPKRGGLWIPNTAALIAGGPNPDAAKRVLDLIVSADTERALFASDSRNTPVRPTLRSELKAVDPAMLPVNYRAVAEGLDRADTLAREILLP